MGSGTLNTNDGQIIEIGRKKGITKMDCKHERIMIMAWPDGGTSELCIECFLTRHIDVFITTNWQNHSYTCIGDWYREAAKLQDKLDKI